jgi:hypothetical protein
MVARSHWRPGVEEGGTRPLEAVECGRRPGAEEGSDRPLEAGDRGRKLGVEKGGYVQHRAVDGGDVGHDNGGERSSEASVVWGGQTRDLIRARLNRVEYMFPYVRRPNDDHLKLFLIYDGSNWTIVDKINLRRPTLDHHRFPLSTTVKIGPS